jgi:hypothetical protein
VALVLVRERCAELDRLCRLRDAADPARSSTASLGASVPDAVAVAIADAISLSEPVTLIHFVLALVVQHWLVVSDVHLDPFAKTGVVYGSDTSEVLWRSALGAMRAKVPDARVVLVGGDMLAHRFSERAVAAKQAPVASALATARRIARDLDAAFPRAQFLVTLGNNDDPCGDYRSETGGAYQLALARIWAPLVDRSGAAPDFLAQFSRGGYYTARVPIRAGHAIVLNSVFWSLLYGGGCFSRAANPGGAELTWLRRQLDALPPGSKAVALMHIPPGYDPRGTTLVHRVVAVPFLRQADNGALLQLLGSHAGTLRFIVGAHAHRYDFRVVRGVPMLVASSVSPIYRNNPAFFVLDVDQDGTLRDVHPFIYDPGTRGWIPETSFDAMYRVHMLSASVLATVAQRIRSDASVRAMWRLAFDAWARADGGMGRTWLPYACAQTEIEGGYAGCAGTANRTRMLVLLAAAALLCLVLGAALLLRRNAMRSR